ARIYRNIHAFPTRRSSDLDHTADYSRGMSGRSTAVHVMPFHTLSRNCPPCWLISSHSHIWMHRTSRWLIRTQLRSSIASRPGPRSEEHTSELQSRENLVCR